jgi:hypothetical protein
MKRKGISKKIRFEVFKRDKFTCQYCGRKSPDVVLNVDHIIPVAKGGTNTITNFITSCFECNSGKKHRKLDDSSVVEKQRKQNEMLQERKEQIELMFAWEKSLADLNSLLVEGVVEYINSKIPGSSLNGNGKQVIDGLLKKFTSKQVIDAVNIAAQKYLKYEKDYPTKDSVEIFVNKIGGILHLSQMSPIKQKLAYIKGIGRNRFNYWNEKVASIILSEYCDSLKKHYTEDQILTDLDAEVIRITKEAEHWSEWKMTMEQWTLDINHWNKSK